MSARIADLDGSLYHISGGGGSESAAIKLRLSFSLPRGSSAAADLAPHYVRSALSSCNAEQALSGVTAPAGSGQVHVDLVLDEASAEAAAETIAQLRARVMAAPIDKELEAMASGADAGDVMAVPFRDDDNGEELCVYIKRNKGSLTAVLPVSFADSGDATIAAYFLQTFPETKRNFGGAPVVNFSRTAPLELKGVDRDVAANCGYVSVVVFPSHCETPAQREEAAWRLLSLHSFIGFHIKASKASVRKRSRCVNASQGSVPVDARLRSCFWGFGEL